MLKSTAEIIEIVESTVEGLGYEFVEFERLPKGMMRVTIDTTRNGGISVNDCQIVSDQLTHLFTVEDVDYERLEVSSPGVERPLKRIGDYKRFTGRPAHIELYEPLRVEGFPEAGRRKLDGRILGVEGVDGDEVIHFSFEEIEVARTPSQAAKAKAASKGKKIVKPQPIPVSFTINDVDRAHLIAQLDFRGNNK